MNTKKRDYSPPIIYVNEIILEQGIVVGSTRVHPGTDRGLVEVNDWLDQPEISNDLEW